MISLSKLVLELNKQFAFFRGKDYTVNGLQIQTSASSCKIKGVVLAVDPTLSVLRYASKVKANLLICHHGLIWEPLASVDSLTQPYFELLFRNGINLYVQHLPLDYHPLFSHSLLLANYLKLEALRTFPSEEQSYGAQGLFRGSLEDLESLLDRKLGLINKRKLGRKDKNDKNRKALKVVVVSGSGSSSVHEAIKQEADVFVTGELKHSAECLAADFGLVVLCYGHRETELLGLQKLAEWLQTHFALETVRVI